VRSVFERGEDFGCLCESKGLFKTAIAAVLLFGDGAISAVNRFNRIAEMGRVQKVMKVVFEQNPLLVSLVEKQ